MIELTSFPKVLLQDGTLAYGGSQNWFYLLWRRLSGCAAVSATNLAAYYRIGMEPDGGTGMQTVSSGTAARTADFKAAPQTAVAVMRETAAENGTALHAEETSDIYTLATYRKHMNAMFREHMTSGRMGFPDPNRYVDEFVRYAAEHGVTAVPETQFARESAEEAYELIKRRLSANEPVVLLILRHTAKELDDITWHWMTVTGLDTETDTLVVSNYGMRETWPAAVVFAPLAGNQTYLIAFDVTRLSDGK